MDKIKRVRNAIILLVLICLIFLGVNVNNLNKSKVTSNLVIYGDNIKTSYAPFTQNGSQYISVDTISKTIDKNIYYDKVTSEVIVTTYSDVLKFKMDNKKIFKNMKYVDIKNPAKNVDGQPYLPLDELSDVYNINVAYNDKQNIITIDKQNEDTGKVKKNDVEVYSDLKTNSTVLAKLKSGDTLTVYTDELKHNRWYKVKTQDGIVGYISKKMVELNANENKDNNDSNATVDTTINKNSTQKICMFWQYGSDLNVLGQDKISAVNVVSPTWFELQNAQGDISSKFNQDYYNRAKNLGYKIWPIITNGIDSANYSASDTSALLDSEYSRQQLIDNIISLLNKYNLDGINIDFENMKVEDKDMFTQFIRELAPMMRKNNKTLSVDMYFVNYIDRTRVGDASDYVILMGYDQRGNWSSTPGSISEISWVEKNLASLLQDSNVPSEKIILGIPFYTRLWEEDDVSQTLDSTVYSMKNCASYLSEHSNLTPVLDKDAGQNYVQYTSGKVTYKLWIEDNDSVKRRVQLVDKYNLAGVSGWKKGSELSSTWQIIQDTLNEK